jgi:hypothetical protein
VYPDGQVRKFVSLWDMVATFQVVHIYWLSHELMHAAEDCNGDVIGWNSHVEALVGFAEPLCRNLELDQVAMHPLYSIRAALEHFKFSSDYGTYEIRRELKSLRGNIEIVLSERKFAYIPQSKTKYVGQDKPCGQKVYDAFPSARFDLTEASDSIACGLHTAAGFHLMRAAEIGLWELGRDRQIPSAAKIEFTEWGKIIDELETEIVKIQQWKNSNVKEEAHRFYNRSLAEIRAFNDGWRRHLAHVRKSQLPLDPHEAMALHGHVQRFLELLALKISEGQYTNLVW